MIRYLLLSVLCSLTFISHATAQGTIRGTVTADGAPLAGVMVQLARGTQTAITTAAGTYELTGLAYGDHTVFINTPGYETASREVKLSADTPRATADIDLRAGAFDLQEVEVLGRKTTAYTSEYSFVGTKTASRIIDVPQTISTVTKELMQDQQAFTLNDVVQNIAGVNQYSSYDDLTVRGFRNGYESGFRLVNGLRSGYSYGNGFFRVPLTVNLERVEVLKGPGAALFGAINPGGTVNMVTKKPLLTERKAVNFSVGSFETLRSTLDFTGPLNKDKTVLYRLNVGYEDSQTFREVNDRRSLMIAPSVTFLPTDGTTINTELVFSSFDGYLDRGLPIRGGDLYALPFSFALNQPSDHFRVRDLSLSVSLNQRITNRLSFNAAYMNFSYGEDLQEHRTLNTFSDAPLNTVTNIRYFERLAKEYTDNLSTYFSWETTTGLIGHQVVVGADYITFCPDQSSTMFDAQEQRVDGEAVPLRFDLKNPVYEIKNTSNYIRRPLPSWFVDYVNSAYHTTGLYLQDQARLTKRLSLLAGLRYELFRDRRDYGDGEEAIRQQVLLPRLGLTYSIRENLNYFASYSQGFKPVKPQFVKFPERYGSSEPFTNESSYQVETGVKAEFFRRALFASVSVYQIEKRNTLLNTGFLDAAGNPLYRQNGRTRSRGVEAELVGTLSENINLNVNYAYNHTEVLDAELAAEEGMMAANAPKHAAGFWARYTFTTPALRGLGVSVGGNYLSRKRMELQVQDVRTGESIWDYWPAYAIGNAAVSYRLDKFRISFNLNNVFDARYFVGGYDYFRASPGAPRNFVASIGCFF